MAMKEKAGRVFSIEKEQAPIAGCTVSKAVDQWGGNEITYFSLAKDTDISAESYRTNKLWFVNGGRLDAFDSNGNHRKVSAGEMFVTPKETPVGAASACDEGVVYTEIVLKEDTNMNSVLNAGEVFALKDLLPYREGQIVNMDLVNNDRMKFVLMSFDEGCGLSEHAAPGEALIFALDGEGVIVYEGVEHRIKAGETFKFDQMGRHAVVADHRFKMALLLELPS